jgi:hypothetical protein
MAFKLSEQIIHLLTVVSLSAGSPAFKMHNQYAIETDNWSLYSPKGRFGEILSANINRIAVFKACGCAAAVFQLNLPPCDSPCSSVQIE